MRRRLLARDWILNRRAMSIVLAIFVAFQVYMVLRVSGARAWSVFTCVYACFLTIVPLTREDKFRAGAWARTLPVTRAEIVGARYLGSWLIAAIAYASALALAAALPGSRVEPSLLLDFRALLVTASIVSGILFLLVPFTIRYGLIGVMIFLVALQVLGVVMLFAAVATEGMKGIEGAVLAGGRAAGAWLAASREALTPAGFVLAALAALSALNWTGYRFALALYNRREF